MPLKKMTFSKGVHKRYKNRRYFSGWKGEGSKLELTNDDSFTPPVKDGMNLPLNAQNPVVLLGVGAVRQANDTERAQPGDSAYKQETTHLMEN